MLLLVLSVFVPIPNKTYKIGLDIVHLFSLRKTHHKFEEILPNILIIT